MFGENGFGENTRITGVHFHKSGERTHDDKLCSSGIWFWMRFILKAFGQENLIAKDLPGLVFQLAETNTCRRSRSVYDTICVYAKWATCVYKLNTHLDTTSANLYAVASWVLSYTSVNKSLIWWYLAHAHLMLYLIRVSLRTQAGNATPWTLN